MSPLPIMVITERVNIRAAGSVHLKYKKVQQSGKNESRGPYLGYEQGVPTAPKGG